MKITILKIGMFSLVSALLFTACSDNEESLTNNELTSVEAQNVILTDDLTFEVDNILEEDDYDYNLLGKSADENKSSVSDCVIRTVVENSKSKTITLDFGESCIGYLGREFSGKIIIEYVKVTNGYFKTITFEDFKVEGHAIEGEKSIVRIRENANGNREATHNSNVKITFKNGASISKSGTRVREMIIGGDTRDRGDDVYAISGSWEYTNLYGTVFTGNIIESLRREFSCRYIVSGKTEITKNGAIYILNFGDGSCDNIAKLTNENGTSVEVRLQRF